MSPKKPRDPLKLTSMYERNLDDSEDSDGEGGLGNLNRMVMRPPGHSGKAKKGHLCFDASFETGNLGRVDLISEFEYDLFLRPDTCCPKLRVWFNFVVDNVKQDQRVIFNVVNFCKSKLLYNSEMTPIVKSSSRPKWQRLLRHNVFYHRSIHHRFRHILSFSFAFDKEEDVYQFAMATPYSYSKLQTYLDVWMRKAKHLKNAVDRQVIGKSIQKRKIDLVTVGEEEPIVEDSDGKNKREKRRVVVIIARTHGGEPPSSFVCQGLMDFLISNHSMAQLLRKNVTFKIIPMLNPDGVLLGNQRTTLMGFDLNRSWNIISPWAHPTLKAAIEMINGIESDKDQYQLDFIIDIHSHSSLKGCFIYGNSYDDVYRYERHIVFPKIFAMKAEGYCAENSLFNADSSKIGTARRFFCNNVGKHTNAFTLQVSIGGYHLPTLPHYIHYNDEAYLRLGRNLGKSIYEYYKQVNIIVVPVKVADGKRGKKNRRHKGGKLKYRRPKPSPAPPAQQYLEPRLFSPSIIRPENSQELNTYPNYSQNQLYEYPAIQTKVHPKKASHFQRHPIYQEDELNAMKYNYTGRTTSPPPFLSIIDLNNTIRNELKDSLSNDRLRCKMSKADERTSKKKRLIKEHLNIKAELLSSDDDAI